MGFVIPALSATGMVSLLYRLRVATRGNPRRFVHAVAALRHKHYLRLTRRRAKVPPGRRFNRHLDDVEAIDKYRFTMSQLAVLAAKLGLDPIVTTKARDKVSCLEAMSIVCRRLSEPSKLITVAREFGRSTGSVSRIFWHSLRVIWRRHIELVEFNRPLISRRMAEYCRAIQRKKTKLAGCWGFIDGIV